MAGNLFSICCDAGQSKFVVGEVLGSGSYGRVVCVTDENDNSFALKIIDPIVNFSFCKEVEALTRLTGVDGVVKLIGKSDTDYTILMQYCDGGTADYYLRRMICYGLSYSEYFFIHTLNYLFRVVRECNDKGVVHCDIKPKNILVTEDCRFILADFGISHFLDSGASYGIAITEIYSSWYRYPNVSKNVFSIVTEAWALIVSIIDIASIPKKLMFSTDPLFNVFRNNMYDQPNSQQLIEEAIDGVFKDPRYAAFFKKWLNINLTRQMMSNFDMEARNRFVSEISSDLKKILIR